MTEKQKQREILKRMTEAAQKRYELTGEIPEGMKWFGEAVGEDVLRQMQSPSPYGAAAVEIMAENAEAVAEKEAAEKVAEEERRRQQEQDDYDAGNNRRAAILAAKRRRAEQTKIEPNS